MTYSIRRARTADLAEIGKVGFAAWFSGIAPLLQGRSQSSVNAATFAAFARACLDQIVVAEEDDQILGFIATENEDNYITDLWVHPDHRGKGVGAALCKEMERRIAARGYYTSEISVMARNARAFDLYQHWGYEEVGRKHKFSEDLGCDIESVRLRKHLPFMAEALA